MLPPNSLWKALALNTRCRTRGRCRLSGESARTLRVEGQSRAGWMMAGAAVTGCGERRRRVADRIMTNGLYITRLAWVRAGPVAAAELLRAFWRDTWVMLSAVLCAWCGRCACVRACVRGWSSDADGEQSERRGPPAVSATATRRLSPTFGANRRGELGRLSGIRAKVGGEATEKGQMRGEKAGGRRDCG